MTSDPWTTASADLRRLFPRAALGLDRASFRRWYQEHITEKLPRHLMREVAAVRRIYRARIRRSYWREKRRSDRLREHRETVALQRENARLASRAALLVQSIAAMRSYMTSHMKK